MGPDNYEDRRRESNDYLDRRDDQIDIETGMRDKSDAIYRAILDHDHSRAEWELGIVPDDSPGTDAERRAEADADRHRRFTFWKLAKARALLQNAFRVHAGFSDALDEVNDVLAVEPDNSEALTLRAIAYSQLDAFDDAVVDADRAVAIAPFDTSSWGQWMRQQLPAWRRSARK
jgi:tetratricopeptide (TPR) repeat protein